MADDRSKRHGQDRDRINISEDYELRDWAQKFGVSTDEIRQAVGAVGDRASEVERYLKGGKKGSGDKRSSGDSGR
jgi:hypothetical protein